MAGVDALAVGLFAGVGLILGLMGSGGSIVALPLLVYAADFTPEEAVAGSLVIVGAASLVGVYLHYRRGEHHWKATALLGLAGMVGAYFGSDLTSMVSPRTLMLVFSGLMLAVGVTMLGRDPDSSPGDRCYPMRCALIGIAVGVITGFLGVGGGFLIVPALIMLAGIDPKRAIAASLGIIFLNSIAGLVGHLGSVELKWSALGMFVGAAMGGMWVGLLLVDRVSGSALRKGFAWAIIAFGVGMGAVNWLSPSAVEKLQAGSFSAKPGEGVREWRGAVTEPPR